jgi:hypothetical protein
MGTALKVRRRKDFEYERTTVGNDLGGTAMGSEQR